MVLKEVQGRTNVLVERNAALDRMLKNLLARIHRDGGHYVAAFGLEEAFKAADDIVARLIAEVVERTAEEGKKP